MEIVTSFDEVKTYMAKVRSLRKGVLTNFFPEERKIGRWISQECLYVIVCEETVLFLKKDDGFTYVLFCSTTKEEFLKSLELLPNNEAFVIDQIVDMRTDLSLVECLNSLGYEVRKCLVRMSKINDSIESVAPDNSFNASAEDVPILNDLLHKHFDKYAEQLPTKEELSDFVIANHAIVVKREGCIIGFILFDKNPSTLCLRYWFVNPESRNQGVGAMLFREYSRRGATCRRHILWVVESNDNAIKRYNHYGYKNDNMRDYVLTINV